MVYPASTEAAWTPPEWQVLAAQWPLAAGLRPSIHRPPQSRRRSTRRRIRASGFVMAAQRVERASSTSVTQARLPRRRRRSNPAQLAGLVAECRPSAELLLDIGHVRSAPLTDHQSCASRARARAW